MGSTPTASVPIVTNVAADGRLVGRRTFEIAGGAHINAPGCGLPASDMRLDHAFRLTLHHLRRWCDGEAVPPHCDRVPVEDAPDGEFPEARCDEHGNPLGGMRSTHVDVPHARYDWCEPARMTGVMEPFTPEKLAAL